MQGEFFVLRYLPEVVFLQQDYRSHSPSCNCCTSKLPSCQAAKLSTCCLLTLSSFSCHTAPKVQHTQKSGSNSRPRPIQTRIQTRSRPQPAPCISVLKLVIVSFPSFLQAVDSRFMKFGTHADRYQERLKSS